MASEKSTLNEPKTPVAAPKALPVKDETPSNTPPIHVEKGEKPVVKPAEAQNAQEKKDTKPQKTDIETEKDTLQASKRALEEKRKKLIDASQKERDEDSAQQDLLSWPDAPQSPSVSNLVPQKSETPLGELALQKIASSNGVKLTALQKKEQAGNALQEQENKTAEAVKGKMDAELESVTKTGKIDQLTPDTQKKIRDEVVRTSIDPQLLPDEKKKEILSTMKGVDGQPIDVSKVKLDDLTRAQRDFILNSSDLKKTISQTIEEYRTMQDKSQKTGEKPAPEIIKNFQLQLGLTDTDALDLSQLRAGMKPAEFSSDTHIGVVQRVLAESTFGDLRETLGDGLRWSHIPGGVKREIVVDSFSYDPAKNNRFIEESINDAKSTLSNIKTEKKEGESEAQFASRVQEKIGVSSTNLQELSQSVEAQKSGLSPMMRMLADFFGPIGAALGMPFWQEYMSDYEGSDDFDDSTSDRWNADSKGGKADISRGVLKSNKTYLDNGKGLKLEGGSYEKQTSSASAAILANKERYKKVAEKTGVPWELIGAIHFRESSLSFNKVLHNGDPLGKKTTRVPAGRGPFATWEESAIDALNMKGGLGFPEITQTNQLEQVAGYAEKYNGFGYRNKGVSSAYVWAGTEAYTGGMYVADHVFSRTKKDPRPGVMAIVSKLIPDSIQAEKRTPDTSVLANTVGAFPKEFISVGAKKNPKTGTTLCSRTAREDLLSVLGRNEDVPAGDAQDVHDTYREGGRYGDMVGSYSSSFSPPENANVADVSLTSKSQYGHRVTAYKGLNGWMVLDPYNGGGGNNPQPWDSYVKKNDVRGVAFYQKEIPKA